MPGASNTARGLPAIDLGTGLQGDPIPTDGDAPSVDRLKVSISGFGFFIGGLMVDHELLGGCTFPTDMEFSDGDAASIVESVIPATADADFSIFEVHPGASASSPVQVGTIHFPAGGSAATVTWQGGDYTLPASVMLFLYAPSPADATLALVTGTINGSPP